MNNDTNHSDIKKKPFRWKYKLAAVALLLLIFAALIFILVTQEQKPNPASEKVIREAAARKLNKDRAVIPIC